MGESKASRGRGFLVELGVVFVGVLIALAADSWVQGLQDQTRAQSYVRALNADLAQARASVERELAQTLQDLEGAAYADSLVRGDVEPPGPARVSDIYWGSMLVVSGGTFDALVSTGDINLLDDSTRIAIVAGYAAFQPHLATMERLYALAAVNVRDHLFTLARLRQEHELPPGAIPLEVARESPEVNATFFLHMGMLANRRDALTGMLEVVTTLEDHLAEAR